MRDKYLHNIREQFKKGNNENVDKKLKKQQNDPNNISTTFSVSGQSTKAPSEASTATYSKASKPGTNSGSKSGERRHENGIEYAEYSGQAAGKLSSRKVTKEQAEQMLQGLGEHSNEHEDRPHSAAAPTAAERRAAQKRLFGPQVLHPNRSKVYIHKPRPASACATRLRKMGKAEIAKLVNDG